MIYAAAYQAANRIANTASSSVREPSSRGVQDLQEVVERQNLLIQTLLMILLEKKVIHEDEFREWLVYVDELDGRRDGKISQPKGPVACPKCQRNNQPGAPKCQYCGEPLDPEFLVKRPDATE